MRSGGWQVLLFHLSCPNMFRIGRSVCCKGVAEAFSPAARLVPLGRVDESRMRRAQYRSLGLAQQVWSVDLSQGLVRVL